MTAPVSTYRLQLGPEVDLAAATRLAPYLDRLGISTLYLSPILAARKGSGHGYDVVDPTRVNPELGTLDDLRRLADDLQRRGMTLLLDIVPNHMAMSHENPWWVETLARGARARHAPVFDIDWEAGALGFHGKVVLPILGKPMASALSDGEFTVEFEADRFWLCYFDNRFPLSWLSVYRWLSEEALHASSAGLDAGDLVCALQCDAPVDETLRAHLLGLHRRNEQVRRFVSSLLEQVNQGKGDPQRLEQLLTAQHYRVAYWRTSVDEINYRRFFTISDLIGVRVEDPWVFDETHRSVLELFGDGYVQGLRIDHIDGLAEPREYLVRLQGALKARRNKDDPAYVIVEKILGESETLPDDWPVAGTTGYEFLDRVNRLFVHPEGLHALQHAYEEFVCSTDSYEAVRRARKREVVDDLFPAELGGLAGNLRALASADPVGQEISLHQWTRVLRELTVSMDAYRTCIRAGRVSENDLRILERAFEETERQGALVDPHALAFLRKLLTSPYPEGSEELVFIRRWQQFTGPVMAKGLEDTTHYSYFPLSSLNDVGSEADRPPLDAGEFHRWNQDRLERGERGLNATSTHDTKRSEDVRARINVLSDIPETWRQTQRRWRAWNADKKVVVEGAPAPDPVLETLIYQTLLGVWPCSDSHGGDTVERVKQYLVKASRERKVFTRWIEVNTPYEKAIEAFVDAILDRSAENPFWEDFQRLHRRVAHWGCFNALSQLLLKIASPGAPDIYRGTELWDFSLVDPDNRRPVDWALRDAALRELDSAFEARPAALLRELNRHWADGRIKLFVTARALRCRRRHPELFLRGRYHGLEAEGAKQRHVCALARQHNDQWAVAAAPRLLAGISRGLALPLGARFWGDDCLVLPDDAPQQWRNRLSDDVVTATDGRLPLQAVFRRLPVSLLVSEA